VSHAHPAILQPIKPLANKDIDRNAAVLSFALGGAVIGQRVCFGPAGGGQHAVRLPAAGLLNIIDDAGVTLTRAITPKLRAPPRPLREPVLRTAGRAGLRPQGNFVARLETSLRSFRCDSGVTFHAILRLSAAPILGDGVHN
jgi:hypothetical protein